MLKDLLIPSNVRNRGQSSSSRIFVGHENFSKKPTQECFEDMLNRLWTDVMSPVSSLKISQSNKWFNYFITNLPLFLSMIFPVEGSGGAQ
jgi:hypothetical protein